MAAAAEARAVWQRAANRYFIQEDAKRAPKLACCSSVSSLISKIDTKPVNRADVDDSFPLLNEKSFDSNIDSDSKWWIQLQYDYMYQRGNPFENRNSHQFVENQDDSSINSLSSEGSYEEIAWWQMGEKDDLGSFDSKKSRDLIENCDHNRSVHTGLEPQKIKCDHYAITRGQPQTDTSKTKILKALCHSQTRAREAEFAAKKAYAEKEHAIKLIFKQASQLFAYRQWIYVLQLENLCYQIKNKKCDPFSSVLQVSGSKTGHSDKNLKAATPAKGKRAQTRHWFGRYKHDLRKYAVVFVVGLGIVGAGLVLGWTVGWMLI